jgi:hypothetical protein
MNHETQIFDSNELAQRKFSVRRVVSLPGHMEIGEYAAHAQRDVVNQLAQQILADVKFFSLETTNTDGLQIVEITASCMVLTNDECFELARAKFKEGVLHARHFMPMGKL